MDSTRLHFSILVLAFWNTLALCAIVKVTTSQELEEALLGAQKDGTILIAPGRYEMTNGLSLKVDGVTVRGAGMEATVLDFNRENDSSEGFLANANQITFEDFTLRNPQGNGLVVKKSKGVAIRRIKTEWTGPVTEKNGGYGIYPVESENVLVEESESYGASDAGIYLGQSTHAILKRNKTRHNVFGIEVENSDHVDVIENVATENSSGIGIFNLPDLNKKDGHFTRVLHNVSLSNNLPNFASKGSIAAESPGGIGLLLLAAQDVEVGFNTLADNLTANVVVGAFAMKGYTKQENEKFSPFSEAVFVHHNAVWGGGKKPLLGRGMQTKGAMMLAFAVLGRQWVDLLWDGVVDPKLIRDNKIPDARRVCFLSNGGAQPASFAKIAVEGIPSGLKFVDRSLDPVNCSLKLFPGVNL